MGCQLYGAPQGVVAPDPAESAGEGPSARRTGPGQSSGRTDTTGGPVRWDPPPTAAGGGTRRSRARLGGLSAERTHRETPDGYCEICGSQGNVQVLHARALADLIRAGRQPPTGARVMFHRRRKSVAACDICHDRIHS
ncbi:HNH endonuclease [Streptomyces sp. NBC_00457]|uniref:HNH endonuclease n=1 Tax=Streptomyces sp. NBC_00457 TaxID=2975748 RepID=UPI002E223D73